MEKDAGYYQRRVEGWRSSLADFPVGHEIDGLQEEAGELLEAYNTLDWTEESIHRVGLEATDVIVRAIGVLGSLGLDMGQLFDEVMDGAEAKYPSHLMEELKNDGLSPYDAMVVMKHRNDT